MRFALALFLAFLQLPVAAIAGPLEDGKAAYDRRDYETALKLLQPLAGQGNAEAQVDIGNMYERGWGVKQSSADAVGWYRKAADQGDADAQFELGSMYVYGDGLNKDEAEATKWHQKALKVWRPIADRGNAEAQFKIGLMYERGWGGLGQNFAEAKDFFVKSADQGNVEAQIAIGNMYSFGWGGKRDISEAMKWYRMAADQGNTYAKERFNALDESLHSTFKDSCVAVFSSYKTYPEPELLTPKAERGDPVAQAELGRLYKSGRPQWGKSKAIDKNLADSTRWLRKAADQGWSQFDLGDSYFNGYGVKQSYAEAYFWTMLAMNFQQPPLCEITSLLNKTVRHLTLSEIAILQDRLLRWKPDLTGWQAAAENGDAEAQRHLGSIFLNGWGGVNRDYQEAAKWYSKMAEHNSSAARILGELYSTGKVRKEDWADDYSRLAQTNLVAASVLGDSYTKGEGVKQDWGKAYFWYSVAAVEDASRRLYENNQTKIDSLFEGGGPIHLSDVSHPEVEAHLNAEEKKAVGEQVLHMFLKPAEQGDVRAEWIVGRIFAWGKLVTQDWVEAYYWFALSDRGKDNQWAFYDLGPAADHLSNGQIAEVTKRLGDWKPASLATPASQNH
jgi:TPR repeat protein